MLPIFDRNPTRKTAVITVGLILANLVVFLYMLFLDRMQTEIFFYRFSVVPWEIMRNAQLPLSALRELFTFPLQTAPPKQVYLPLLTSMFLHDGWMHILGNMLFLWIFGNNVEEVMGHIPFLGFYLACGLCGTMAHVAVYPRSIAPLLGASGAISGIMGSYLLLYPRALVYTVVFFIIIPVPAFLVIGSWIILQFLQGLTSFAGGMSTGTAWFAHLGGVAAGIILTLTFYPLLRRRRDALILASRVGFEE